MSETVTEWVLPTGTHIGEYEVKRVLGIGGFGITYLAVHSKLGQEYAIKEYMPQDFSRRASDMRVVPAALRSGSSEFSEAEMFSAGLRKFLKEAKLLTKFDHPHIVRAHNYIEANDTGYIVMEYVRGKTLRRWLENRSERIDEQSLKNIFLPVLDGLAEVHKHGLLHRDIKPENIYLRINGSPLLLDFGTARDKVPSNHRSMHIVVTSGYSPIEQYAREGNDQGPWTDVYAVGGTLYRCIYGAPPPNVMDRVSALEHGKQDPLLRHDPLVQELFSSDVRDTISRCLALNARDRFQSAAEVSAGLMGATRLAPFGRQPVVVETSDGTEGADGDRTRTRPSSPSDGWLYPFVNENAKDSVREGQSLSEVEQTPLDLVPEQPVNASPVKSEIALEPEIDNARRYESDRLEQSTISSSNTEKWPNAGISNRQYTEKDEERKNTGSAVFNEEPMSADKPDSEPTSAVPAYDLDLDDLEWIPPSSDTSRQEYNDRHGIVGQILRWRFVRWQNPVVFGGTVCLLLVFCWMLFKPGNPDNDKVVQLRTMVDQLKERMSLFDSSISEEDAQRFEMLEKTAASHINNNDSASALASLEQLHSLLSEQLAIADRRVDIDWPTDDISRLVTTCENDLGEGNCLRHWFESETGWSYLLQPFEIDRTAVTFEQFAEFARDTGYETLAEQRRYSLQHLEDFSTMQLDGYHWRQPEGQGSTAKAFHQHPVVHVSFHDAEAYCNYRNARIPTIGEWNYAATVGFGTGEAFRESPQFQKEYERMATGQIGSLSVLSDALYRENTDIYGMGGNVWEWTSTPDSNYPEEGVLLLKGGSWNEPTAGFRRSLAVRSEYAADSHIDVGFRCVSDVDVWPN